VNIDVHSKSSAPLLSQSIFLFVLVRRIITSGELVVELAVDLLSAVHNFITTYLLSLISFHVDHPLPLLPFSLSFSLHHRTRETESSGAQILALATPRFATCR
jgi:hypothetical protein